MMNINPKFKRVVFGILFVLSLASIFLIYFTFRNNGAVQPTPEPLLFKLTGTYPANGVGTTIPQTSAIEFMFNKPIDVNTLTITSSPSVNLRVEASDNKRSVYVRSTPYWKIGKDYILDVSAYSTTGEKIENYKYNLRIEQLKDSGLIENW